MDKGRTGYANADIYHCQITGCTDAYMTARCGRSRHRPRASVPLFSLREPSPSAWSSASKAASHWAQSYPYPSIGISIVLLHILYPEDEPSRYFDIPVPS